MNQVSGRVDALRYALAAVGLLGLLFAGGEAEAALEAASLEAISAADCQRLTYLGFENGATADRCEVLFFMPTSAAFKCSLYKEAGYPSSLMRKACLLYDRGYIQSFTQGADSLQ